MENIHNIADISKCDCFYSSDIKGCLLFKYINLEETNIIDIKNCPYRDHKINGEEN